MNNMNQKSSNKQIAKNTLFLYLRMIVSIAVNLYTVRILWDVLGVDNYGIYNVVGGIVMMFAFLNTAMVASSQRFISYELGRGDMVRLQKTFSISILVHVFLAVLILILAETIGLWFLNHKLNIPFDRLDAANWVYQCSILSFMVTIVSVPYNACIVAHEHMKVYGYFGIIDVFLKLGVVLLVAILPFDRLIAYSVLILVVLVIMRLLYGGYCRKYFEECKFCHFKDKSLIKDMFSFAGWSFLGNMGFSVRDQGINIILNMFFGVTVNAAKGIANQVGTVINGFASNFTMAVNPQITKRYATGEYEGMLELVDNGCKFALLLMSIVVIPVFFSADTLLHLWLGEVAPYTVGFLQLTLIMSLIDCVVSPITTALQATGRIKKFQIIISCIMIANLPLAWLWLKMELNPYVVIIIAIMTSALALCVRLMLLHELIQFSYRKFFMNVYSRTLPCILLSSLFTWWSNSWFEKTLVGLVCYASISVLATVLIISFIALSKTQRQMVFEKIVLKKMKG